MIFPGLIEIARRSRVRFPYGNAGDLEVLIIDLLGHRIVDPLGQVLGRGVDLGEWEDIVQKSVLELVQHITKGFFEIVKVHCQADIVQALRGHGNGHAPVMAVELFTLALIAAKLMGSREF